MNKNAITDMKDFLHAKLCYQLFITPIHPRRNESYRTMIREACQYIQKKQTAVTAYHSPRHHVIHEFTQPNPDAPKILITHGWLSRAAYMSQFIHALHTAGYAVYAIDFPAHGEAKGIQLHWSDAIKIIHQTLNQLGPFYGVIGHSFGGCMLLNTLNLASQFDAWRIDSLPKRAILLASPVRMRIAATQFARKLKLNGNALSYLRKLFQKSAVVDLKCLDVRKYQSMGETKFLCLHGEQDTTVPPSESIYLCKHHAHASLVLYSDINHLNIIMNKRVEQTVLSFLEAS